MRSLLIFLILGSMTLVLLVAADTFSASEPPTQPEEATQQRFLRGGIASRGGYSGGGVSSYHSSSSYSSPSYHSYHSNTFYNNGAGYSYSHSSNNNVGFILFVFLFLCCPCCGLFALCIYWCEGSVHNNNKEEREAFYDCNNTDFNRNTYGSNQPFTMPQGKFDNVVHSARDDVENAPIQAPPPVEPYSGKYHTSYVDRTTQVQWNATLNLYFTRDFAGRGYRLSGDGADVDGTTVIEDGHANFDGTAWWKERVVTGDVGLQVVSRGKFDFAKRTFQGNWLANSGEEAAYISFQAEEEEPNNWQYQNNDYNGHPPPSAPMEEEIAMPMAMAVATTIADDEQIPTIVASAVNNNPKY